MVKFSFSTDSRSLKGFQIAGWKVEPLSNCIARGSEEVRLEPRVMAVLQFLVSKSGSVATREALESTVWEGRVVGYDALSNTIIKLRKALGDNARSPHIIETVSKTGYRLIADVVFEEDSILDPASVKSGSDDSVIAEQASIAVLAFDNLSGDAGQEYFGDGLAEDIITDLSRTPGLFVIARNSSFAYKGRAVDARVVCAELGVRYLLEGSVRREGNRLRITVQLIDGVSGGHVWADRYDRDLEDVFKVQEEVTQAIVSELALKLTSKRSSPRRETYNFEAYDYFLKGRDHALRDTEDNLEIACVMLEKAIELDPEFSSAYSYLTRCHSVAYINGWGPPERQSLEKALELGQKAVSLDEENPHAHFTLGTAAIWLRKNELALAEITAALAIDGNFAEGYGALAMIQVYSERPEQALKSLATTMRLDPHYRDIFLHLQAQAYFHLGEYHKAVTSLKRRLVRKPDSDISHALLASAYGHLGQYDNSRISWQKTLAVNPGYSIDQRRRMLPYRNPADFEVFVDGLRKAGLVEHAGRNVKDAN
jgi:adenylate cyclase